MAEILFQWTFEIKDYLNFDGASIAVYAPKYKDALRKVRDLQLPQLATFEVIEDAMKLVQVYEIDEIIDLESLSEPKDDDDLKECHAPEFFEEFDIPKSKSKPKPKISGERIVHYKDDFEGSIITHRKFTLIKRKKYKNLILNRLSISLREPKI